MRLHRLTLTDYRGIEHRDITFADHGVTVVAGANEIGKSSLIEALDLLLEYKDRSAHKQVKAVKPTHADVGAQVEAEISTGRYRFIYRKRFHKNRETALTIVEPVREQLSGDEAHERVQAMLAETMDTALWQAQRVLQATATSAVDLSDCDALSRALDIAAGQRGEDDEDADANPVLIEAIESEYRKYFTATGRDTGEWAEAKAALREAKALEARCLADVTEVEERLQRHAELSDQITEEEARCDGVQARVAAATTAAQQLAALITGLDEAEAKAQIARAAADAAGKALADRRELAAEVTRRASALQDAETVTEAAAAESENATAAAETATAAAAAADRARLGATEIAEAARAVLERLRRREEADRLTGRLAEIDTTAAQLQAVDTELSAITMTDKAFGAIKDADDEVRIASARADLAATVVELSAGEDVEITLAGEQITLPAGQSRTLTVAAATEIALPGSVTARIVPPATAADTHSELVAARERLQALLAAAGVHDLAGAKALDERRRELVTRRDGLRATLAGYCAGEQIEQLRGRADRLRAELADAGETEDSATDLDTAQAAATAATDALAALTRDAETKRTAAAAALELKSAADLRAAAGRERVEAARTELAAAATRLEQARAENTDEKLAEAGTVAETEQQRAEQQLAQLEQRFAEAHAEEVTAELRAAEEQAAELAARLDELRRGRRDAQVALEIFGGEGRTSKLQDAQIALAHATAAHDRTRDRARAVETLRSVMAKHRENTRRRYVEPFRAEVQRLGRSVFGDSFEVEVDSDLRICSRTLDGCTVPFESLSGGAKEQLGIIARLAVAALVAGDDTVPVVIDDALGFTDPDRLARMAAVFDLAGADGQVIVLTCSPQRFDAIAGAHRIELGETDLAVAE